MKKIAFVIIFPIILVISCIYIFGINAYNNSYKNFQSDGYVISVSAQEKYFFSANGKYKINEKKGNVEFDDKNETNVKVEGTSFIHYVDGSISTFKKAVILDLEQLNGSVYQYYNFFPETVFSKVGNEYSVSYLDKKLTMTNLLLKIAENKYMIMSDSMVVNIGDEHKIIKDNYLEITYMDGNVIRLDNQEISIQNISSSFSINIGEDIYIDLLNKKIYNGTEEKINLGEITINSNDNIDIVVEEKNKVIASEEEDDNKEENNSSGKNKLTEFQEVKNGIVDIDSGIVEEIVDENAAIKDAEFEVSELTVTSNALKAIINVKDTNSTLEGNKIIKLIKNDTNEVIYYEQDSSGKSTVSIDIENLKPETNYTLIINQDYMKNEMRYNKDFVQKAIVTLPLGIDIEKNYVKTDEINVIIYKKDYSNVTSLKYKIYDKPLAQISDDTEPVIESEIKNIDAKTELKFDKLNSDTVYTLILTDFVYENIAVSNNLKLTEEYLTLKSKPIIGKSSFSIDKQNSKFVLYLNNVRDIDNGIESYHAEIYDISRNELVLTKNTKTNNKIEIPVDDEIIQRNTNYRAYIYLTFYDNEKEYEIPIGNDLMNLNATNKGPILSFNEKEITWESISGTIVVDDSDETIDYTENIVFTYQSLSVGTTAVVEDRYKLTKMADEKLTVPITVQNLRANDSYIFTVKAKVNYNDGNGYVFADIGSFIVQTGMPQPMTVEYTNATTAQDVFKVKAKLRNYDVDSDTTHEAETLSQITFKFYSTNYDTNTECKSTNGCWEKTYYDANPEFYESDLKEDYYDSYFYITPDLLDINEEDITYGLYTIEVSDAKDYTTVKNDLPILQSTFVVNANSVTKSVINKKTPLDIREILNNGKYENLNDDTIIGYRLSPNVLLGDSTIEYVIYHVYSDENNDEEEVVFSQRVEAEDGNADIILYFEDYENFERGKSYYFTYEIKHSNADEIEKSGKTQNVYPKKQEPVFELYLSKRYPNETSDSCDDIVWKYKLKDIDSSIVRGEIKYWLGNVETNTNEAAIVQTNEGEMREFVTSCISPNVTLNLYRWIELNEEMETTKVIDAQVYIENRLKDFNTFNFDITEGVNVATINLKSGVNDLRVGKIVSADVTLTANDGTTVTLPKQDVINKKINISYMKIKKLRNKGDISVTVKLYYDNGQIGPDNEIKEGYAIKMSTGYYQINSKKIFNNLIFDFNEKKLYLDNTEEIPFVDNKGYIRIEDNDTLIKILDTVTGTCEEDCTFSFDSIIPSFELTGENIVSSLTAVTIKPEITNVDEDIANNVKVELYKQNMLDDNSCDLTTEEKFVVSLEELENGYTFKNLSLGTKYCIKALWYEEGQNSERRVQFYYPQNQSYEYTYLIETLETVNISNYVVKYSSNNGRNMNISYKVGIMDGYDGVMYRVVNSSGDVVDNIEIPTDDIDTIKAVSGEISKNVDIAYKINTTEEYFIELMPYILESGDKHILETKSTSFRVVLNNPEATIIRKTNSTDGYIRLKVRLSDPTNATYERNKYKVYIRDISREYDSIYGDLVESDISTNTNIQLTIDRSKCSGECNVYVVYEADLENKNNYQEMSIMKEIMLEEEVILADPIPVSSDKDKIVIAFSDYLNLQAIKSLNYTIISKEGVVTRSDDISPVIFTVNDDNELNYAYLTIDENIPAGGYSILMQFYWETDGGTKSSYIDISLEYVKN